MDIKKGLQGILKAFFSCQRVSAQIINVPRTGVEPARPFGHHPLKMACLPISPPGRVGRKYRTISYGIE